MRAPWLPVWFVVVGWAAGAEASDPAARRIDPLLRAGGTAGGEVAAVLRLPGLDAAQRAALEAEGVRFRSAPDGRTRRLGALHPVHATTSVLAALARRGIDVRVSRPAALAPTLYPTAIETEAIDLAGFAPTPTAGPLGHRVVLGTFEPGLDLFHPHFFRADGGAWPWIDVDGDGALTPGVDAVDADLDGEIDAGETLQLLDYGFTIGQDVEGYAGTFQTAWDYLWLDLDGSGARELGAAAGYDESAPGYGEPMFMPDDADGDGVLSPDERVVLLGTSQVAGLWGAGEVWLRGADLVAAPPWLTSDAALGHGTSTMGIMTGGQTHPFRGNRGHVPDADIAVLAYAAGDDEDLLIEGMAWMTQDMGATVVNHSWGSRPARKHADGSDIVDAMIDAASETGAVQVCGAGNRRALDKHRTTTTTAGVATFAANMPSTILGAPPHEITFDLQWEAVAGSFTCTITRPSGATHVVQEAEGGVFEELVVDAFRSDSERGWALLSIEVSHPSNGSIGSGTWTFECAEDGAGEIPVYALVSDASHSQPGVAFVDPSETTTLTPPATADACIVVGGYPIQYSQYGVQIGELEPYSSAGPRIDGAMVVAIAAPVDAVTPTNHPDHVNAYKAFSGTSGSAPQVSAIVGLMRSLDPELSPAAIAQRIRDAGAVDEFVGDGELPDPAWGHGKLRGYEAFTGEGPPPRPKMQAIELEVDYAYDGGACAATVHVDGVDWDDASFRWDLEYDGTWDTDFEPADARTIVFDEDGETFQVRVDAGERGFIVAGAVLTDEVPADCFDPPPADDTGTGTGTVTGDDDDDETDDDDDDDDDGTSSDGEPQTGGSDGCGCRPASPSALGLLALAGVGPLRRRRTKKRGRG
jgi:MYXO-CTERM domain-containing protein